MLKKAQSIVEYVIYEQFGNGNFSKYEELIAKDVKCYCPKSWEAIHSIKVDNRQRSRTIDQEYAQAFQFNKVEIADLIMGEEKIVVSWASEGLHRADFFDMKASQRPFHLSGHTIYQFNAKEQIESVWQSWDMLGLLEQIKDVVSLPNGSKDLDAFFKKASTLSEQELECLRFLLQGKTAKETALLMRISFRTVEYYFENIKDKLTCFRKRDLYACARLLDRHHMF